MRLAFTLICLMPILALAQPTPPNNLNLEDLRIWLKQNWYDGEFTDLGYSLAREQMYGFVDNNGGQIECIYTRFQQAGGYITFPDPINAEHLVPQSFYGSNSPMRSDIHNIRPCHGSANSARGNRPYGEVSGPSNFYGVDGSGDYLATSSTPTNPEQFSRANALEWEPRDEYKGDIARQIFYFYTMYPTEAGSINGIGDVNELYQWHLDDPVSSEEMTRNIRINTAQGNLNPYVSHPDAVYNAWFFIAVNGCTNPTAINYNPAATMDDGSCVFIIEGCTYDEAINFNPAATVDDGSCSFPVPVLGCTYPDATNFNPAANQDDGSCTYPLPILGCTYPDATNFNPSATQDDGSCTYPLPVLGCTYPDASNYSPGATEDDGSCMFELQNTCVADVDGNGFVDIQDLLDILAVFGTSCN